MCVCVCETGHLFVQYLYQELCDRLKLGPLKGPHYAPECGLRASTSQIVKKSLEEFVPQLKHIIDNSLMIFTGWQLVPLERYWDD